MKILIVSLIFLVLAAAPASANLVVDGSFEFGDTGADTWVLLGGNGTTFGAWTWHSPSASRAARATGDSGWNY